MPRSPRATMIPPLAARTISAEFSAAWRFSILAIRGMLESSERRRSATGSRSAAVETKEIASRSRPCSTANSTQPRSPSVDAGTAAPGTFIPLWEESVPPTSTSAPTPSSPLSSTRRRIAPSAR